MMNKKIVIGLIIVLSLIAIALLKPASTLDTPSLESTMVYPNPRELIGFELINHQGKPFTKQQFMGIWSIVFFGYTHCPDICPTTMTDLAKVVKKLPAAIQKQIQVVFISVDPARDTQQQLAEYIPFFHPDFIGLTGQEKQLERLSSDLGAMYMKVPTEDSYAMSHSNSVFLIDPKGRRYGILNRTMKGLVNVPSVIKDLESILASP